MVLIVIGLLFLLTIFLFSFKKNWKAVSFFLIILLIAGILIKIKKGYLPIPFGARRLFHMLISPNDLYAPIVTDDFHFYEKGFSKTYSLEPKYLDFYDCGFSIDGEISHDFKFNGVIKFEFYLKDKKLFENIVMQAKTFTRREVSLIHFEVPLMGKYKDDIKIKVTVLEPDLNLLQHKDSLRLYIGVSSTP